MNAPYGDREPSMRAAESTNSVRQDFTEKGRAAAAALTAALSGSAAKRARNTVLPTTLVVRDSTAPPGRH